MDDVTAARFVVVGNVQGVSYRQSCALEAARLGVRGWVRNRDDGAVEGVAEGSRAAVEALLAWCARGPARARVARVDVTWAAPADHEGFVVRR